jgi:hypothetical protein
VSLALLQRLQTELNALDLRTELSSHGDHADLSVWMGSADAERCTTLFDWARDAHVHIYTGLTPWWDLRPATEQG